MLYGLNSKLSHTSLTMRAAHSPGGALLRQQQDQVFGHGAHHAHGRPSEPRRPDCTGSRMALKCPTSSRPCDSSLSGHIRHKFFKEYMAPLLSSSIKALQWYMHKVCPCFHFLEHPLFANIQSGPGVHVALDPGLEAAVSHRDKL